MGTPIHQPTTSLPLSIILIHNPPDVKQSRKVSSDFFCPEGPPLLTPEKTKQPPGFPRGCEIGLLRGYFAGNKWMKSRNMNHKRPMNSDILAITVEPNIAPNAIISSQRPSFAGLAMALVLCSKLKKK